MLSFYSPGDLSELGIEPSSPGLASGFFTTDQPGKSTCFISASRDSLLSLSCLPLSRGSLWSALLNPPPRIHQAPCPFMMAPIAVAIPGLGKAVLSFVMFCCFQGLCSSFLWTGQHACQGDAFNILPTFPSSNI